ncbi:MAG: alpha/beta fold hydrolase [Haloarculaceae archaeon]
MPTTTAADGTAIHYTDRGEGPPVLFVHGTFMSGDVWAHQHPAFPDSRTLALDCRGHGASEPADDYSLDAYASDLRAVLDDAGVETATLVGWSNGAKASARFAVDHPDRVAALCLVSSNTFHGAAPPDVREPQRDHLDYEEFLADLRRDWPGATRRFLDVLFAPDVPETTREWVHRITLRFPLHAVLGHYEGVGALTDADYRRLVAALAETDHPTMVCHGALDSSATLDEARAVAERLDARFVAFEESAHFPFLTDVERFNGALASFLDATRP